jgi:hypothetical protein
VTPEYQRSHRLVQIVAVYNMLVGGAHLRWPGQLTCKDGAQRSADTVQGVFVYYSTTTPAQQSVFQPLYAMQQWGIGWHWQLVGVAPRAPWQACQSLQAPPKVPQYGRARTSRDFLSTYYTCKVRSFASKLWPLSFAAPEKVRDNEAAGPAEGPCAQPQQRPNQ